MFSFFCEHLVEGTGTCLVSRIGWSRGLALIWCPQRRLQTGSPLFTGRLLFSFRSVRPFRLNYRPQHWDLSQSCLLGCSQLGVTSHQGLAQGVLELSVGGETAIAK